MCGGSILACRFALDNNNFGFHIGGGFHHSFDDHGEGFCILNDVAVAIRVLKNEGLIKKVAVIDVDVHQGNGTAWIFRDEPDVFTFSIHNELIYPFFKTKSDLDIGLITSVGDDEYNEHLQKHIPEILWAKIITNVRIGNWNQSFCVKGLAKLYQQIHRSLDALTAFPIQHPFFFIS